MSSLSIGGINDILKNPKQSFLKGLGWLHVIAGLLFLTSFTTLLFDKTWFLPIQVDSIIGILLFILVMWGGTWGFGWLIEEAQRKIMKQNIINWNDVWWTSFGAPIALIIFFSIPVCWYSTVGLISTIVLSLMTGGYVWYRKNNK